jgi:choline dehydrogenase-like flavoprotein
VIYFLLHTRGNKRDFDRWSEAGNYGWSYDEILPYFMKSEKANLGQYSDSPYHNRNGPLSVTFNSMKTPLAEAFVKANKMMGMNEVDYNGDKQMGVSYVQANTIRGRRQSAYKAFLEPVLDRSNLHIMINTKVTKVLIDPQKKVAYGVEFARNNKKYRATAKREVILSSGTFHSPQLLTLSGVGLKHDLHRIGVPLIHQLPVGRNMHDHITFSELTFVTNKTNDFNFLSYINSFFEFVQQGKGMMTLPAGVEALSFIKVPTNNSYGPDVPDIELVATPGSVHMDYGFGITRGGKMKRELYDQVYKPLEKTKFYTFLISLMLFHPKSVGHVEIPDRNPFSHPKIHPNFFKTNDDIETILHGIKYVLKLVQMEPYKSLGARLHSIPMPPCSHHHFMSDNYWRCVIRMMAFSIQHQVGTCKMGPVSDPNAVVSPELKVHGIKRLRVVDTSIIPEAPTAHTNAISVMIGEKAADLIKSEWKNRS